MLRSESRRCGGVEGWSVPRPDEGSGRGRQHSKVARGSQDDKERALCDDPWNIQETTFYMLHHDKVGNDISKRERNRILGKVGS